MSRELQGALFKLLEILAGALAFATALALEAEMDLAVVLGLGISALLSFLAGIGLAFGGVLAHAPRETASFMAVLAAVTASLIAGAYFGGWVSSESHADGTDRLASRVTGVFDRLADDRAEGIRRLANASTSAKEKAIALELSDAFELRAKALSRIRRPVHGRSAVRGLAACVSAVAGAYEKLAASIADPRGSQAKLDRARRGVEGAERALPRCASGLARQGYLVVAGLHPVT